MGKTNNRNKGKQEEELKILDVATEHDVVIVDTSALDKELENADGASLVMPITGGMSDKSSKKEAKKESKKDKDGKTSSISETFSKFLKGEADVSEIGDEPIDTIKEFLENQNLVELGKFIQSHPEVLEAYIKSNNNADENKSFEYQEEKIEDKMEEKEMGKTIRVELNKKARKNLREQLVELMEKLNDTIPVKPLFKVMEEKLDVNVVKFVNKLIDNLENYDEDKFNAFLNKTVKKLESGKLADIVQVLTGETISHLVNLLFDNEKEAMADVSKTFEYRIDKIIDECGAFDDISQEDLQDEDILYSVVGEVIDAILKEANKRKEPEKCEKPKFGSIGFLTELFNGFGDAEKSTKLDKGETGKTLDTKEFADSVYAKGRQIYKSIYAR